MNGWCPWDVLEVPSGIVETIYTKSSLGSTETLILKNWPIFPVCMWKWDGSAPCGQARLWRPNWTQYAQRQAVSQSPSSRAKNCGLSPKSVLFFDPFLGPAGLIPQFACCWPYFVAGILFGGLSRTRGAKCNLGVSVLYGIYGHIHRKRAIFSNAVLGVSRVVCRQYQRLNMAIMVTTFLCFRSATSHLVQNTRKIRFFDPILLTHKK